LKVKIHDSYTYEMPKVLRALGMNSLSSAGQVMVEYLNTAIQSLQIRILDGFRSEWYGFMQVHRSIGEWHREQNMIGMVVSVESSKAAAPSDWKISGGITCSPSAVGFRAEPQPKTTL